MAAKAHLRNLRPLVIAVSTNDGLGVNAKNIGTLLSSKNIFMVPFGQDSPIKKSNSLVAHMNKIPETIIEARKGRQIQPLLVEFTGYD
jgi:dipicolinate synthase subunit B